MQTRGLLGRKAKRVGRQMVGECYENSSITRGSHVGVRTPRYRNNELRFINQLTRLYNQQRLNMHLGFVTAEDQIVNTGS